MTGQLQEKRKAIGEVSDTINNGLSTFLNYIYVVKWQCCSCKLSDMNQSDSVFHLFFCSLQQVDENRKTVTNEIKKAICNLIMEINRKGKILINQLEVWAKCIETIYVISVWICIRVLSERKNLHKSTHALFELEHIEVSSMFSFNWGIN